MALLKWIHLRHLLPLSELIGTAERGGGGGGPERSPGGSLPRPPAGASRPASASPVDRRSMEQSVAQKRAEQRSDPKPEPRVEPPAEPASRRPPVASRPDEADPVAQARPTRSAARESPPAAIRPVTVAPLADPPRPAAEPPVPPADSAAPSGSQAVPPAGDPKDRLLERIKSGKRVLYGTSIAQAQRIEFEGEVVRVVFLANQRFPMAQMEQNRTWLEQTATEVAGRPVTLELVNAGEALAATAASGAEDAARSELKQRAMADTAVQAMLDVFTAEIRNVEEIEK